ncbi:MAG: cytochrome b N-terminal domain-containing protein [Limnochordaceae bacterium]|uniref:Selenite/tellurite reduction operon b-type cytochrome ExtP n=1 Tax=Carboxydichorda subterranea TaxID=3109565 RepID=A0ABZ1BUU4_9FIRM|nr:selenite/tellurite reduction operon b-type cytochrome ExtP [Limnochorda sp. L945t]MBE3597382.1 cytochrome b N-terminal domain-containing protein [Limnochordaceae bacterium]WRP16431.1 selenite/tellurite reduction operon b-type cytochrome ExtP [Limnochorda sp. L945t]
MGAIIRWVKSTRLFRSIYREGYPTTPRTRVAVILNSLALHLHPVRVPRRATRVTYTWGLGGLSVYMFVLLTITGVFLMWYYIPSTQDAYWSIRFIESEVTFGQFMRNLHRWAAHGMVIIVFLHMCRVFYTGAYKPPREFNWVIGVALLTITFLLSFTGYLLPWDQLAYWAITVGTNMGGATPFIGDQVRRMLLGGLDIGQATLVRWYTLHVIFLPLLTIVLMSLHFWRVRKDGNISTPVLEDEPEPPGYPPVIEQEG